MGFTRRPHDPMLTCAEPPARAPVRERALILADEGTVT
jgi:hypothetical protein